jgi:hypothetical protein
MKPHGASKFLTALSELLFSRGDDPEICPSRQDPKPEATYGFDTLADAEDAELADLLALASSNHVIVRAFGRLEERMAAAGNDRVSEWAASAIENERRRIGHALPFLDSICGALEEGGCEVVVIKSLDHWPDLGSDLDLYTDAAAGNVVAIMRNRFGAHPEPRSWGDRLANKWNFVVPDLPELVEVHVGRLGQTGEQIAIAGALAARSREVEIGAHVFRVPSLEDRLLISTLQRMYRHFYIRLCDVADTAKVLESDAVDYPRLRRSARSGGLWEGLSTYLCIVSDYVKWYGGRQISLPSAVTMAARFGSDQVSFSKKFLRIPILPHSVSLYATELKRLMLNGELRNTLRLSLLPCLATAAALEFKITGSDKGIW